MLNFGRPQFQALQQAPPPPQLLTPLTDAATDRCSALVSPSTTISSPPALPHDEGPPRSADSPPPTAAVPSAPDGHAPLAAPRRRAVDASDLRQCALVQTRLKAFKSGYVLECARCLFLLSLGNSVAQWIPSRLMAREVKGSMLIAAAFRFPSEA